MFSAKNRLIVALDFPSTDDAREFTNQIGSTVSFYKIGLELLFTGGVELVQELRDKGSYIFFDAKLLDIGNTVERSVSNIAKMGATFLTVHGTDRKTMEAAVRGRGGSPLKLLCVTVMTNLDQNDLDDQGISMTPGKLAEHRASLAHECGFDGVISSGHEATRIRRLLGPQGLIVTPGIRPDLKQSDDQARVMTPELAIRSGASHLVVGRPITRARDPRLAAQSIIDDIDRALVSNN